MLFLISAYPAVRVKFYAYVNMLVIINKLTYYLLERKAVCKPATTRREENQCRNNANDSFGKGFDVLKDHMLNRKFNDWALPAYSTAVTAEVPLAFSPK